MNTAALKKYGTIAIVALAAMWLYGEARQRFDLPAIG